MLSPWNRLDPFGTVRHRFALRRSNERSPPSLLQQDGAPPSRSAPSQQGNVVLIFHIFNFFLKMSYLKIGIFFKILPNANPNNLSLRRPGI